MAALIPIVVIGFTLILVVVIAVIASKKAKERTAALQLASQQMGWSFMPKAAINAIPYLDRFHLFSQGHSKNILNMVYGQINESRVALFDYKYTVGYGRNQHTYSQSVVYFESPNLSLPSFSLSPENWGTKMLSAFGYQDIDFNHRPDFSKKYLLRGPDENAIRQAFHDQILAYYEANQGLSTDGGGNQIFFYRHSHRVQPHEARSFVDWGVGMYNLFRRR